jgi:hypothetical protein
MFEILACIIDFNFFCFKHLFFIELQISRPCREGTALEPLHFARQVCMKKKSDAQMALEVGEVVNLRLGSSELLESQVIRVHDGEEERVDMQLLTPKANGKLLMYKGVSPPLSFCDDSRWVEAAAVVTGFETSEVTSHPGALSLKIYVVVKLLFYFINYVQIPERLKRMEQTLKKREIEPDSTGHSL